MPSRKEPHSLREWTELYEKLHGWNWRSSELGSRASEGHFYLVATSLVIVHYLERLSYPCCRVDWRDFVPLVEAQCEAEWIPIAALLQIMGMQFNERCK